MMNHMGIIWEHKGKKKGERGVWGRRCKYSWQHGWNIISNKCQNLTHEWKFDLFLMCFKQLLTINVKSMLHDHHLVQMSKIK